MPEWISPVKADDIWVPMWPRAWHSLTLMTVTPIGHYALQLTREICGPLNRGRPVWGGVGVATGLRRSLGEKRPYEPSVWYPHWVQWMTSAMSEMPRFLHLQNTFLQWKKFNYCESKLNDVLEETIQTKGCDSIVIALKYYMRFLGKSAIRSQHFFLRHSSCLEH